MFGTLIFLILFGGSGKETKWASRSGYLDPEMLLKFYNAPVVVEKYEDAIQTALYEQLRQQFLADNKGDIAYVRVFGELFGGKYEGHKVKHRAIQKEVSYCPDIEFIVFDIEYFFASSEDGKLEKMGDESEDENTESAMSHFLTPAEVITLCQSCNIPVLDILHSGTLDEMMELNKVFQSTVPATIFNLPPMKSNNEAEGYVLKPKSQVFYKPDKTRILLKHKNPKFTESRTTVKAKVITNTGANEFTENEAVVFEELKEYINENRINAVLSKLDENMRSKRKAVFFLISNDAFEDILLELSHVENAPKKERSKYKKHLNNYTEEYCNFHKIDFLSS